MADFFPIYVAGGREKGEMFGAHCPEKEKKMIKSFFFRGCLCMPVHGAARGWSGWRGPMYTGEGEGRLAAVALLLRLLLLYRGLHHNRLACECARVIE